MGVKGKFITFEGAEGSGKSTQSKLIHDYLVQKGKKVLFIREPGGVKISEAIRNILLDVNNKEMNKECETLLYMAARAQLVEEVIAPALKAGTIVLCDRFLDSTIVYQGYGNGVKIDFIKKIGKFATQNISPNLTFLFDIETEQGLSRKGAIKDRIEQRPIDYHRRVRQGYLALAKQEPQRIKVVKVNRSREEIFEQIVPMVNKVLGIK
jgi:dTMP kinase